MTFDPNNIDTDRELQEALRLVLTAEYQRRSGDLFTAGKTLKGAHEHILNARNGNEADRREIAQ